MRIPNLSVLCICCVVAATAVSAIAGFKYAAAQTDQRELAPRRLPARPPEAAPGQRWEYCAITKAFASPSVDRGTYTVLYLRSSGMATVPVDENATESGGLAKAIGKLGDDGWELVGDGPFEFRQSVGKEALYFKRQRR